MFSEDIKDYNCLFVIWLSTLCFLYLGLMKIRLHFMIYSCRKPGRSQGLQTYVVIIVSTNIKNLYFPNCWSFKFVWNDIPRLVNNHQWFKGQLLRGCIFHWTSRECVLWFRASICLSLAFSVTLMGVCSHKQNISLLSYFLWLTKSVI